MISDRLSPEDIKRHRQALRLSQSELAHFLGVTENTVGRWEQGVAKIGNPRLLNLAFSSLFQVINFDRRHEDERVFLRSFTEEYAQNAELQLQLNLLAEEAIKLFREDSHLDGFAATKLLVRNFAKLVFEATPFHRKDRWIWKDIESRTLCEFISNRTGRNLDFFKSLAECGFELAFKHYDSQAKGLVIRFNFNTFWARFGWAIEMEEENRVIKLFP